MSSLFERLKERRQRRLVNAGRPDVCVNCGEIDPIKGELLKSLKTLVHQIDEWEAAVQEIVGTRRYPWGDLEEARALIARIEGGQ